LSIEEVLPVEVMQHVLGFVPLAHLAGDVARTSRLWRSLALDPALWLPHWRRLHFARPNVELPVRCTLGPRVSCRAVCVVSCRAAQRTKNEERRSKERKRR
jgi:hypothetical protein